MRIYIPTRARVGKQVTRREFFLDDVAKEYPVVYIVPESEREQYLRAWPNSEVTTVPDEWKLSDIRQHLITDPSHLDDPHHVIFDDDLVFLRRKAPLDVHQRKGNRDDATQAFKAIEAWLRLGYAHGALSQRGGNNHCEHAYKFIGRATDTHFYNAAVLAKEQIKINQVVLRQDFHTTLSLLRLGYPNVIDHEFMSGQKDGQPGGCQVYRTHAMLEEQAHLLAEIHAPFVTVVTKERKGGFGVSTDVRIAWKKAFESAGRIVGGEDMLRQERRP